MIEFHYVSLLLRWDAHHYPLAQAQDTKLLTEPSDTQTHTWTGTRNMAATQRLSVTAVWKIVFQLLCCESKSNQLLPGQFFHTVTQVQQHHQAGKVTRDLWSLSFSLYGCGYPSQAANINTDRHAVGTAGPLPLLCCPVSCPADFQVMQQLLHSTFRHAAISEYLFQAAILNSIIVFLIPDFGFRKTRLHDYWQEAIFPWLPRRNSREYFWSISLSIFLSISFHLISHMQPARK